MIKLIFLLLSISYAYSANWLMIQGTQKETTKDHNLWGFGQLRYTHNRGDIQEVDGMKKTPFSLNKPDTPYNSKAQSILDNVGDIARIQLTWVYR